MGLDILLATVPYGERWQKQRRLFRDHLGPVSLSAHLPIQERWTRVFLNRLLENPEAFRDHVRS
jgi:cytochrome P450